MGGAGVPLVKRQRELRHREGPCNRHLVRRAFLSKPWPAREPIGRRRATTRIISRTIGALLERIAALRARSCARGGERPQGSRGLSAQPFALLFLRAPLGFSLLPQALLGLSLCFGFLPSALLVLGAPSDRLALHLAALVRREPGRAQFLDDLPQKASISCPKSSASTGFLR